MLDGLKIVSRRLHSNGCSGRRATFADRAHRHSGAGKMFYAVLGAVAQFERDVLRERTIAGVRAAKTSAEAGR